MNYKLIKAALIDMDGTLYDSMPNHARAWQRMMKTIGVDVPYDEFFLYEGQTGANTIDLLIRRAFGRPATDVEKRELYALKSEYFAEQPPVEVMPGAVKMVETLRSHGVDTVLVTGSGQNTLLSRLEKDFPGAFPPQKRITSASVTHGKPHPEPYLKGLELAGVRPQESVVIDNAPLGTASGHAAGIYTVGVVTGPIPGVELLANGADIVYNSMWEFAESLSHGLN